MKIFYLKIEEFYGYLEHLWWKYEEDVLLFALVVIIINLIK